MVPAPELIERAFDELLTSMRLDSKRRRAAMEPWRERTKAIAGWKNGDDRSLKEAPLVLVIFIKF